jgi:hypothetical protein
MLQKSSTQQFQGQETYVSSVYHSPGPELTTRPQEAPPTIDATR